MAYIIWKTKDDAKQHALGVYGTKEQADKEAIKYKNIVFNETDDVIGEFSTIGNKCNYFCTKIKAKVKKRVFFLKIHESGGGGRYHEITQIVALTSRKKAIKYAVEIFSQEHNRDDECEMCRTNDLCKKEMIRMLESSNRSYISATDYEGITFEIWDCWVK
jgi:hypothetical protein